MPTTITLDWNEPTLPFVVAHNGQVLATGTVSPDAGLEPAALGKRLAKALAPHLSNRTKIVVALGRGSLAWQHLSLPPCPADELADVVRMQADRDSAGGEEDVGFDYLTLVGDEHTPYQVLTVSVAALELTRIRQVGKAANLTIDRILPLAVGWPAIVDQASAAGKSDTHIYVAPQGDEPTLWATRAGQVVLFRQLQLPTTGDVESLAAALGSELRRTRLALSQQTDTEQATISIVENRDNTAAEISHRLSEQLNTPVTTLAVSPEPRHAENDGQPVEMKLPLVGIAIEESLGKSPLVDLLHPHRRPRTQVNVRTYALAATAGTLLVGVLAWSGYSKLQNPLEQAAQDQAELTLLEEPLDELEEYERRAKAIQDWQVETPNLLLHLQQVSKSLRPKILGARDYPVEEDVVLDKFTFDKRQLTIDALARSNRAVQPLENRLRELEYRPQRGQSEPSDKTKGYPWHFKSTIEITAASDPKSEPVNKASDEEPPS